MVLLIRIKLGKPIVLNKKLKFNLVKHLFKISPLIKDICHENKFCQIQNRNNNVKYTIFIKIVGFCTIRLFIVASKVTFISIHMFKTNYRPPPFCYKANKSFKSLWYVCKCSNNLTVESPKLFLYRRNTLKNKQNFVIPDWHNFIRCR